MNDATHITTQPEEGNNPNGAKQRGTVVQCWSDDGDRHWLRDTATLRITAQAGYTQIAYLNGYVGYTAYYGKEEGVCTPEEFVKMIAVL